MRSSRGSSGSSTDQRPPLSRRPVSAARHRKPPVDGGDSEILPWDLHHSPRTAMALLEPEADEWLLGESTHSHTVIKRLVDDSSIDTARQPDDAQEMPAPTAWDSHSSEITLTGIPVPKLQLSKEWGAVVEDAIPGPKKRPASSKPRLSSKETSFGAQWGIDRRQLVEDTLRQHPTTKASVLVSESAKSRPKSAMGPRKSMTATTSRKTDEPVQGVGLGRSTTAPALRPQSASASRRRPGSAAPIARISLSTGTIVTRMEGSNSAPHGVAGDLMSFSTLRPPSPIRALPDQDDDSVPVAAAHQQHSPISTEQPWQGSVARNRGRPTTAPAGGRSAPPQTRPGSAAAVTPQVMPLWISDRTNDPQAAVHAALREAVESPEINARRVGAPTRDVGAAVTHLHFIADRPPTKDVAVHLHFTVPKASGEPASGASFVATAPPAPLSVTADVKDHFSTERPRPASARNTTRRTQSSIGVQAILLQPPRPRIDSETGEEAEPSLLDVIRAAFAAKAAGQDEPAPEAKAAAAEDAGSVSSKSGAREERLDSGGPVVASHPAPAPSPPSPPKPPLPSFMLSQAPPEARIPVSQLYRGDAATVAAAQARKNALIYGKSSKRKQASSRFLQTRVTAKTPEGAVVLVQRGFRSRLKKLLFMVLRLQSRYRGAVVRRLMVQMRVSAGMIQHQVRRWLVEHRYSAARRIQATLRGALARDKIFTRILRKAALYERRLSAAISISRVYRGWRVRGWLAYLAAHAVLIQRAWRQHARLQHAAIVIQRIWRGHVARVWRKFSLACIRVQRDVRRWLAKMAMTRHRKAAEEAETRRRLLEEIEVRAARDVLEEETEMFLKTKRGRAQVAAESTAIQATLQAKIAAVRHKADFEQRVLRLQFDMFDVDHSGLLSRERVRLLLDHLCIPASDLEVASALLLVNQTGKKPAPGTPVDPTGQTVNVQQFLALTEELAANTARLKAEGRLQVVGPSTWDADGATITSGTRRALLVKQRTAKLLDQVTGKTMTQLATARLVCKARASAAKAARREFRRLHTPPYACPTCVATFVWQKDLRAHRASECDPVYVRAAAGLSTVPLQIPPENAGFRESKAVRAAVMDDD